MKKTKVYLIVPLVVLVVFGAYYWSFKSDYDAKQAAIVATIKEQKLEKLRQEAVLREAAIHDAIEAQKQRKKERQEREAREQKQKDDKENAKLNADKAVQEEQKLERQLEKLTGDVKAEKEEIVKIEAENKKAVAEQAFLKDYVKMAQDNQASLAAVLTKIAAADSAVAKAAAAAAAAAAKK
jgi:preprotein translocase subunit SecF